jgi:hypothetical protein
MLTNGIVAVNPFDTIYATAAAALEGGRLRFGLEFARKLVGVRGQLGYALPIEV